MELDILVSTILHILKVSPLPISHGASLTRAGSPAVKFPPGWWLPPGVGYPVPSWAPWVMTCLVNIVSTILKNTELIYLPLPFRRAKPQIWVWFISEEEYHGRNIIYRRGSYIRPEETGMDFTPILSADYLFIALSNTLHVEAARFAKEHGVKVLIDADNRPLDNYQEILPYIDYFIASEFVYDASFRDENYEAHMQAIRDMGPSVVIFTFGSKGCRVLSDEGYCEIPAFKIKAFDTCGAGDTFHGAFFYGLKHQYSIRDTAIFASAVSGIKCTSIGGRAGIPTPEVTKKFIETGEIDDREIKQRVADYSWGINTFFRENSMA